MQLKITRNGETFVVGAENQTDELMHYGVPGMKWGHRKALPTSSIRQRFDSAKSNYKSAKKAYNKAFNKASNYSSNHAIGQFTNKKKVAEADKRWNDAINKADKVNKAQAEYKKAKQARKSAIKNTYKSIDKKTSFGERLVYNDATRKKAAKYVVDNNMSLADANKRAKKDAWINTAIIGGAIGAASIASIYMNK